MLEKLNILKESELKNVIILFIFWQTFPSATEPSSQLRYLVQRRFWFYRSLFDVILAFC